jgi:hypothetical protein
LPPYNAPAAISKDIPPSIGTHGGGQHPGPPEGGGGAAKQNELKPIKKTAGKINFALINFLVIKRVNVNKINWNSNCSVKIMPNIYICNLYELRGAEKKRYSC